LHRVRQQEAALFQSSREPSQGSSGCMFHCRSKTIQQPASRPFDEFGTGAELF
jgi:hypothetical protein